VFDDNGKVIGKRSESGTFTLYKPRGRGKKMVEPQAIVKKSNVVTNLSQKDK
jgi:hypothetical protein